MTRFFLLPMLLFLAVFERVVIWWRRRDIPPEIREIQDREAELHDQIMREEGLL